MKRILYLCICTIILFPTINLHAQVLYGSKDAILKKLGQTDTDANKSKDIASKDFSQNTGNEANDYGNIIVVTDECGIIDLAFKTNENTVYRCYMPCDIKNIFLDKEAKFDANDRSIYRYAYMIKKDGNTEHIRIKYYVDSHLMEYDNYYYLSEIDLITNKKPDASVKIYTGYQVVGKKSKGIVKVNYTPTSEPKSYKSMYYFGNLNKFWSIKWVVKAKYDNIQLIEDNSYAFTQKGKLYGVIELSNETVQEITEPTIECDNVICAGKSNDQYIVLVKRGSKFEWVSLTGKTIAGTDSYDDCIRCYDCPSYIKVKKDGKWGAIDHNNNIVLPIQYDLKPDYYITRNGECFGWDIQKNRKQGIMGINQKEAIPMVYDRLLYLDYTYANSMRWYAQKDGKWGIIDSLNHIVLPFEYDGINSIISQENVWAIENDSLIKRTNDWEDAENSWIAMKNGKWGIVDINKKIRAPFKYDNIKNLKFDNILWNTTKLPHIFEINTYTGSGLMDMNGTILLPPVYSEKTFNAAAMLYPQSSFTVYFYNQYHPNQKGRLETDADFSKRKKDKEKHNAYIKSLLPAAEQGFITLHTSYSASALLSFSISEYDEKNQRFILFFSRISQEGYVLNVPKNEANAFKDEFNTIRAKAIKTVQFFINNDLLSIGSVTFTTSKGKKYQFIHPQFKGYTGAKLLNLNFKD